MFRILAVLVVVAVLAGALFVAAGRGRPPTLTIEKPDRAVGQQSELQVTAGAPRARFTSLVVTLEQNGRAMPLFMLPLMWMIFVFYRSCVQRLAPASVR